MSSPIGIKKVPVSGSRSSHSLRDPELDQELLALGITRDATGRAVFASDPEITVPTGEFVKAVLVCRGQYGPSSPHYAWLQPPTLSRPPGLRSPRAENARLFTLVPADFQFWPAEFIQYHPGPTSALALAPEPATIQSGGGYLPCPPSPQSPAAVLAAARRSRGVRSSSATAEALLPRLLTQGHSSKDATAYTLTTASDPPMGSVLLPRLTEARMLPRLQTRGLSAGAATFPTLDAAADAAASLPPVATTPAGAPSPISPRGSVFYKPKLSAAASEFIPRATDPSFRPKNGVAGVPALASNRGAAAAAAIARGPAGQSSKKSGAADAAIAMAAAGQSPKKSGAADAAIAMAVGGRNPKKSVTSADQATASKPAPVVKLPPTSMALAPPEHASTTGDLESDIRVVVITAIPKWMSVDDISNSVSSGLYGALFAIELGADNETNFARVIFRDAAKHATDNLVTETLATEKLAAKKPATNAAAPLMGARGYYKAMTEATTQPWADRDKSLWPFPRRSTIGIRLQSHPSTDLIKRMTRSFGADGKMIPAISRRLTLVGKEKLFHTFKEKDILDVLFQRGTVLSTSVQRSCVYNAGNATIVFSDVAAAVEALKCFDEYNSTLKDDQPKMSVTYSKDPCEVELQYIVDPMYGRLSRHYKVR
ncbi:hypothetical protein V494_08176 [Pseudogymnoascus sp. VKM F-4513 (FW-928)]|nr:hypothetical protein V494_08176 [Pseudogymnoascus sp. VKM F-4513 (FW-928)]